MLFQLNNINFEHNLKKKTMEQQPKRSSKSIDNANETAIYKLMVAGILVCMVGVYLRFAADSTALSIVSWAILFIGSFICCKAVFKILGS